jgi:hypothetical protein
MTLLWLTLAVLALLGLGWHALEYRWLRQTLAQAVVEQRAWRRFLEHWEHPPMHEKEEDAL